MSKVQDGGAGNTQSSARTNIIRKMMPDSLEGKFYKKTPQTQQYIVIHNTAGGTASSNCDWFHSGQQPSTSIHYCVDDKEVYQLLENNWKAHHCGDKKDADHASSPMSNSNTIGIEVADGDKVDHNKAIEVTIELTRYLMKEMNIDADHVCRHHDVTGKQCPATIMKMNKWEYILSEIKKRNESGQTIELDTSKLSSSGNNGGSGGSSGGGGGSSNVIDILPNVDHRYNIANMDEIKGACIIFYPPYNTCEMGARDENFKKWGWNRKYHYVIDHSYNVDEAPPEDDIPEITECTTGSSSDSNGTEDGGNTEGGTDNENDGTVGDGTDDGGGQLGDDDLEFASISIKSLPTLENTIFVGDSLTVGLKDNVTGLRAHCTGGHAIHQGRKAHMADLKNETNVENFVISYGVNDAGHQQPERFKKYYIEFINELKEAHPNAKFYVNKIFLGDLDRATNDIVKICLQNVPSHNDVLPEVCTATGAELLDCLNYIRDYKDYYTKDGIHFVGKFYPMWKDAMLTLMGNNNDTGENGGATETTPSGGSWTTPNVESPDATEDNCITIKGGFEKIDNRLLQCYGLEDNDKVTYINRALFNGKVTKHTIMIACFIPSYEDLEKAKITYEQVEKNIVNSVSKILWANGLNTKDLWREFDMNRAPSPAIYLDRDKWKDLLTEIDKVLEWRNKKFGVVSTTYEKYVATISEYVHSGNSAGVTPSEPGTGGTINSDNEVVKIVYETLTGLGLTAQAACAILGNMYQESRWKPDVVNSIGASGLCQWLYDRKTGLMNYAKSKGTEWTDVKTQAEWAWMEAEGKDPTTKSQLDKMCGGPEGFKKMTDIEKATTIWRKAFERCKDYEANDPRRINTAKECYSKVSGGTSTASINNNMLVSIKSKGTLSWPCPSTKSISSKFGPRNTGIPGASKNHKGIDIPCPSGSDVVAAAAGKVVLYKEGYNYGRGNYLVIDHGNGLGTLYQHLNSATVSVGNAVQANQTVAKSGATGIGSGPHLHFEVHENFSGTKGTPVNPENYVSPGTASGSISGDSSGGSSSSGGDSSGGGGTGWTSISGPLVNSPHGDIVNPGPAANLPYSGNSMGGLDHDDWGGKTTYKAGEPEDPEAEKPEIENVYSSEEYKAFCERFFVGENFAEDGTFSYATNFKKYWELIDIYVADFEPYDKGLVDEESVAITPNDRLNALTTNFTSDNENTFHFNVVESGPGSSEHCVKSADELNVIVVPEDLKIEPIYPDLIIPPHYSTTDYDTNSPNTVPLNMIETMEATDSGLLKQIHFDYQLLKEKKKETNKCSGPINFLDPYPTDDKIQELEAHYPKIFIDEIESQMYSCNHPGCPIAQPMAKNFAMLQDAIMNQSKRVEKRVSKLENILSTIMRNQARLGSRVNINCVYYGGQSTLAGKYKCIRCLHDDRVHDGAIVTIDQCLNCTRYEPILGQVYQILDETGLNGSIILDDMQMSYSDLYAFQQLNTGTERSAKYDYVEVTGDKNVLKPEKTLQELWLEANKEAYLKKSENTTLEEEDEKENENKDESGAEIAAPADTIADIQTIENSAEKEIADVKEADYVFRMDWRETYFNHQEPDVKTYPLEGIIARYKKADSDLDYETYLAELDPELDKDVIEDVQKEMALVEGEWIDTREQAETIQVNKYSSEKFYFDGFAEMKTTVGAAGENGGSGSTGFGAECRAKITEMATTIVADYDAGKAKYCQDPRTTDYTKPQSSGGKVCYDCTSFVSCCYRHAGLNSMVDKSCSGGTLMAEICNNGGEMWLLNDEGLSKAKPGDVVIKADSAVSDADMQAKKKVSCSHAMIYMGDGSIAHASSPSAGIKKEDLKSSFRWKDGKHFFVRPKDLIDADAAAASSGNGGGASEVTGTIDGQNYVATIQGAVCTSYYGGGGSASGIGLENGKTCASHNMPYGTKLYIPSLKSKLGTDGIITVTDTGGPTFDFDIYSNKSVGKVNADVYVISWGDGKVAPSYTWGLDFYSDSQWNGLKSAWNKYKSMNGKLMSFLKFSQEDANIKNHKRY